MKDWLIQIRENQNMTQEDVAKEIGTTRQAIIAIETDNANPSVKTAKKIAEVLNFNWTLFFSDEDLIINNNINPM